MTEIGRPAYQQIADGLRAQIASGELPVGSPIPSTAQLGKQHGFSVTVVRAAINQLRAEGLVVGQPGKAVYVRATPKAIANERLQLEDLAEQIEELRTSLKDLPEIADLRRQVGLLETRLIDLYSRVGQPYPHEQENVATERQASSQR